MQTYILICWIISIILAYNIKGIVEYFTRVNTSRNLRKNTKLKAIVRQEVIKYLEELKND